MDCPAPFVTGQSTCNYFGFGFSHSIEKRSIFHYPSSNMLNKTDLNPQITGD